VSGRGFVEHDPEREQVGPAVELVSRGLLRGHVGHGAERDAGHGELVLGRRDGGRRAVAEPRRELGQAEVQHLDLAPLGQEDVRRLDVAVEDAVAVSPVEGVRHLNADVDDLVNLQRTAGKAVPERLPLHQLHHDEGASVVFSDVVDGADVPVIERGGGPGLHPEPVERLLIARELFGHELDGNRPPQPDVLGSVDDAHSASAQLADDSVVRDRPSDHASAAEMKGSTRPSYPDLAPDRTI